MPGSLKSKLLVHPLATATGDSVHPGQVMLWDVATGWRRYPAGLPAAALSTSHGTGNSWPRPAATTASGFGGLATYSGRSAKPGRPPESFRSMIRVWS